MYRAYVDIGVGNAGSVKRVGGSPRRAIEVTSRPIAPIAVRLTADRQTVQAKDEVTFVAQVDSLDPNLRFRFRFGDRPKPKPTEWQASPRTTHVYASSGTYPASVEVRSGQQSATSKPLSIKVEPAPPPSAVDLFVAPRSVLVGFPVYFRATANSASAKTRYRFSFGDGSTPSAWQDTREATHIYSVAGNYPAFVEITRSNNQANPVAASRRQQVRVTPVMIEPPVSPTPSPSPGPPSSPEVSPSPGPSVSPSPGPTPAPSVSPSPGPTPSTEVSPSPGPPASPSGGGLGDGAAGGQSNDRGWIYLLLLLILLGGYQGWKYFFAPTPTLEPHADPGVAESGRLGINFQMELDPSVTDGQYTVDTNEGSFIKSERKSDG